MLEYIATQVKPTDQETFAKYRNLIVDNVKVIVDLYAKDDSMIKIMILESIKLFWTNSAENIDYLPILFRILGEDDIIEVAIQVEWSKSNTDAKSCKSLSKYFDSFSN